MSTSAFLKEGLGGSGAAGTYSLSTTDQAAAKKILGHSYKSSRVRYWKSGKKTAWVLEEIGKTRPITTGFVVDGGKIHMVRVLVYRESHCCNSRPVSELTAPSVRYSFAQRSPSSASSRKTRVPGTSPEKSTIS